MLQPLRVDDLCEWKPGPGLRIAWRLGLLLELERHHARVQPVQPERGQLVRRGDPVRLPLALVRAAKRRAIAVISTLAAGRQVPAVDRTASAPKVAPGQEPPIAAAPARAADLPALHPVLLSRAGPVVLRAQPRPPSPLRSRAFLDFVRRHPCCACPAPADFPDPLIEEEADLAVDAHHQGPRGVGQKTDDLRAVPLCRRCHDGLHDTGALPGRDRAQSLILIYRVQVDLLVAFYGRGEGRR